MAMIKEIELKASICTDTPTGADLFEFGDGTAQHIENTGIERNGGLAPLYEQETTFAQAGTNSIITESGDLLQVVGNGVFLNNTQIGNVGAFSVYVRGAVPFGYIDAAWSSSGTILGIKRSGGNITFEEYDPVAGAVLHSRTIAFTIPANVTDIIGIIRYPSMAYADNQEFFIDFPQSSPVTYILRESGLVATQLNNTLFDNVFRFAAGKYLGWRQGVAGSGYIGDVNVMSHLTDGKWFHIEFFPGTALARAIVTFDVYKNASNTLTGMAWIGYTSGGVFNATLQYIGPGLGAVTATVSNIINGPGYSEATYTRSDTGATTYFWIAPQESHAPTDYILTAAATGTANINGYGKLNDNYGATDSHVGVRWCMISGIPSYLSAAPMSSSGGGLGQDWLGVPLTNNGEIDTAYDPQVISDAIANVWIMYKYNKRCFYIWLSSIVPHTIAKVSENLYKINCISPINLVDMTSGMMTVGSNDYNGRFYPGTGSAKNVAMLLQGDFANGFDTGERLQTNYAGGSGGIIGIEPPVFWDREVPYEIDIYLDEVYQTSVFSANAGRVDLRKVGLVYVPDTRQGIAMGYTYGDHVVLTDIETIFTGVGMTGSPDVDYDYDGYELGNQSPGLLSSFTMFEQRYVFDGYDVFSANFSGPIYTGKSRICPGVGLTFIAASPVEAYFLSAFDNSLYLFNGGRSLGKMKRMNDLRNSSGALETIQNGVYSVTDNTLLLQTASTFVWIRDGIVSQTNKKATQTGITIYDTQKGLQIANNTTKWRYTFFALTGPSSTVVPFTWQSAFLSVKSNKLGTVTAFYVTLYNPAKSAMNVDITVDGFDQQTAWHEDHYFQILASDWDSKGFWRSARVVPQNTLSLGVAVGVQETAYAILNRAEVEFTPDMTATPQAKRSN